jgi:hypothetical protein
MQSSCITSFAIMFKTFLVACLAVLGASAAPTNNTLFFYTLNPGYARCGDVDAAPRMPAALFEPENKAALEAYINMTIALYHVRSFDNEAQLHQGTCKEHNYGNKLPDCKKKGCPNPNPQISEWAPKNMMIALCVGCKCVYPNCKDVPDDPKTGHWCSLCGPKYNAPIEVTLYGHSGGQ